MGGARVVRRGRLLKQGRAPQDGLTPLFIAAWDGHVALAELLVAKGADKDAMNEVRGKRGGNAGRSRGVGFLTGLEQGC